MYYTTPTAQPTLVCPSLALTNELLDPSIELRNVFTWNRGAAYPRSCKRPLRPWASRKMADMKQPGYVDLDLAWLQSSLEDNRISRGHLNMRGVLPAERP